MTLLRTTGLLAAALLLGVSLAPAPARAAPEDATGVQPPVLQPRALDLLPMSDLERAAFNKQHGPLVYRIQVLIRGVRNLDGQIAKLAASKKEPGKKLDKKRNNQVVAAKHAKLQAERRRQRAQLSALMTRLTFELQDAGVEGALIAWMNKAPTGAWRLQRYGQGLILLVDDLSVNQRAMFTRVVAQLEGAFFAITAQRERTMLTLKQSEVKKDDLANIRRSFDRQLNVIDHRFWQLVDFTLDRDQKRQVWKRLPQKLRRKSQPVEHLYALPGLTPTQGYRLKALLTELEQESSPDHATVKRINVALRKKGLARKDRDTLSKERGQAYQRLAALRLFSVKATRTILTEAQWLEFESIPPRVSINDRRANYKRIFEGFEPSAAQRTALKRIADDARLQRRSLSRRTAEIRRDGAAFGPDSPQMMAMEMAMAGVRSETSVASRAQLGKIFSDVLTPAEVSRWVMGHYGDKR